MRNIITQSVVLPAAAASLFDMYLDPQAHEAITGAPVTIGSVGGSDFKAFGGVLSGTVLGVVRSSLIVQSWRSAKFEPTDLDSTLILSFQPEGANGRIDLVHLDVPDHDYNGVVEGWEKFYWTPWRSLLARTVHR
ncbi:MAG TPA: SRPBCC domain-containing protein [Terriglobia bacterium]|nr:SRPBCC domain-containing protein [Terriglobia bacterium]